MSEKQYSQGRCATILRDGEILTIEQIIFSLRESENTKKLYEYELNNTAKMLYAAQRSWAQEVMNMPVVTYMAGIPLVSKVDVKDMLLGSKAFNHQITLVDHAVQLIERAKTNKEILSAQKVIAGYIKSVNNEDFAYLSKLASDKLSLLEHLSAKELEQSKE